MVYLSKMVKKNSYFVGVVVMLFCFMTHCQAAQDNWPLKGEIQYAVYNGEKGPKIGENKVEWQRDGANYQINSQMKSTGMLATLYSYSLTQMSQGKVERGNILPETYQTIKKNKTREAKFDWQKHQLSYHRHGDDLTKSIKPGDQDTLSLRFVFSIKGIPVSGSTLQIATEKSVKQVRLENLGESAIKLKTGMTYNAVHLRLKSTKDAQIIDMWLAKDHHLLPVRVMVLSKEGNRFDEQAVSIR